MAGRASGVRIPGVAWLGFHLCGCCRPASGPIVTGYQWLTKDHIQNYTSIK